MEKQSFWQKFKDGLVRGFGWSLGVTLGFAFISTVLVFALSRLGGLPLIGGFIANIVEATLSSLN